MTGFGPLLIPALGALAVLSVDLLVTRDEESARGAALAGIRMGALALASLAGVAFALRWGSAPLDGFTVFGAGFVIVAGSLVLALSLTHFGMARSRPAEPVALLLFAWAGAMAAIASESLLFLLVALELATLPVIALVALDGRRLSSSESSLKAFFANAFASLVFAQGLAFLFGATGRLDIAALSGFEVERALLFQVGASLLVIGLLARAAVAPFHPWFPDVYDGAPSFVTAHFATIGQATCFLVLLRLLHALPMATSAGGDGFGDRLTQLLVALGALAILWGNGMALVQGGLRRLVGWLSVGQVGFLTLALVEARTTGGSALLWGLVASGAAMIGVMATFSSMSHHERACEQIGDLAGMLEESPVRAGLLGAFLLSLGGMPGTIGFIARYRTFAALEDGGHRAALLVGLGGTVLALSAVGRPLLAMMRTEEGGRPTSKALSNEQVVLLVAGIVVLLFGMSPILGETNLAGQLAIWIDRAAETLRR